MTPRSSVSAVSVIAALLLVASIPKPARAFGDAGAFDPRVLLTGDETGAAHPSAPASWSSEARVTDERAGAHRPLHVRADEGALTDEPFVYWSGTSATPPLTAGEISGLRRFLSLGGVMFVDDAAPHDDGTPGSFGLSARSEIRARRPRHDAHLDRHRPRHLSHVLPLAARRRSRPRPAHARRGRSRRKGARGLLGARRRRRPRARDGRRLGSSP